MRQRLITAAVLIPIVLICLLLGSPYSVALGSVVYIAMQFEFSRFGLKLPRKYQDCYLILSLALLPIALIGGLSAFGFLLCVHTILQFVVGICIIERELNEPAFEQILLGIGVGSSYITLFGILLPLALFELTPAITIWTVFVVSISDSAAYFGGSYFGGALLSPRISPKKTISGLLSGMVVAILLGTLLGRYLFPNLSLTVLALACLSVAVAGVFGDLAESLIKRTFMVKDSGTLLPGHGGILDRVDALLFAVPCSLFLFRAFGELV